MGADLAAMTQEQAMNAGADFVMGEASGISQQGDYRVVETDAGEYRGKAVIIAAGSTLRLLGIPGEEEFMGRGVSQCATCDGPLYSGEVVGVAGGGDSAADEALVLSQYAERVLLFHRRDELRAQQALVERVLADPKIEVVWDTIIDEVLGEDTVSGVRVTTNLATGEQGARELSGLFVYVGLAPNADIAGGLLDTDGGRPHPGQRFDGDGRSRRVRRGRHPPAFIVATGVGSGRRRHCRHRRIPLHFRQELVNLRHGVFAPLRQIEHCNGECRMTTTNTLNSGFDDAERGLEWLEKLEALQSRSASQRAAYEVAEYVMMLRTAVTELAGDRTFSELSSSVGAETARLVEELRGSGRARLLEYENPSRPPELESVVNLKIIFAGEKYGRRIHRPSGRAVTQQQDHRRRRAFQQPGARQLPGIQLYAKPGLPHHPSQPRD